MPNPIVLEFVIWKGMVLPTLSSVEASFGTPNGPKSEPCWLTNQLPNHTSTSNRVYVMKGLEHSVLNVYIVYIVYIVYVSQFGLNCCDSTWPPMSSKYHASDVFES